MPAGVYPRKPRLKGEEAKRARLLRLQKAIKEYSDALDIVSAKKKAVTQAKKTLKSAEAAAEKTAEKAADIMRICKVEHVHFDGYLYSHSGSRHDASVKVQRTELLRLPDEEEAKTDG